MYKHINYFDKYGRIMQFNKNKSVPVHRWYSFVEGYSKEFIESIVEEIDKDKLVCLEPFSGSGTTALELQNLGYKCYSFEINPLMYTISRVKLEKSYDINKIGYWHTKVKLGSKDTECNLCTNFPTLYETKNAEKWNFDKNVGEAIQKLKINIDMISDNIYKELFTVALSSILLDVSNLYRNGKCLSYKKDWKNNRITENEVFEKFDNKIEEIKDDVCDFKCQSGITNKEFLYNEDSRVGISKHIEDNSIDLVITSPPYLNSRDYTDTYMLELKTLGYTENTREIQQLREKTFRSHVQIKWKDDSTIDNDLLESTIEKLKNKSHKKESWNDSIIDMVRLYFVDIDKLFCAIYAKMKDKGRVYFNVSNSAYFDTLIDTLEICSSIAENIGFKIVEIRDARYLKTSPQQRQTVKQLLEGVIVMEK